MFETKDIIETISMIREECLDIRTITMGISLYDCQSEDADRLCTRIYDRIMSRARNLVKTGEDIENPDYQQTRFRHSHCPDGGRT